MRYAHPLNIRREFQYFCYFVLACSPSSCAIQRGRASKQELTSLHSASSPQPRQSTGALLGEGYVPGHDIVTRANGDQILPAMLKAIRGAKRSINFETY